MNTKIQRIGKHTNSILKDTELGRYNNNQAITHQKIRKERGDQRSCFRMWQKIIEWETKLELFSLKYPQFSSRYLVFKATRGFPGGPDSKESACNAGDPGSFPESKTSPGEGNGNPLQCSCLENSMNRGGIQSMRSHRLRHDEWVVHIWRNYWKWTIPRKTVGSWITLFWDFF